MHSAEYIALAKACSSFARGRRLLCLFIMAFCAVPFCAAAQKTQKRENAHRQIDRLEEAFRNAVLTSNSAVLNSLLADDYTAITANGTLQTKQDWLANLRSGRVHFTSLDVSDRKVRFYGNTAVVTSRADVQGTTVSGAISGNYRYTRVYIRNSEGKWKIVSFEASRIRHSRSADYDPEQ
jgi:ketosteroid isomerase-like protein